MNTPLSVQAPQEYSPFNRAAYDSTPHLSKVEQTTLDDFMDYLTTTLWWPPSSHQSLQYLERLLTPIDDILERAQCPKERYSQVKRFLLQEMHRRRTTFWEWPREQWVEIIGASPRDFCQRKPHHPA